MTSPGHQLAELFTEMTNTHNPGLVDRFIAEDYVDHNDFVAGGREANRQFWTAFFTGLPDVGVTMEDLIVSGDRVVGRFTYRGDRRMPVPGILGVVAAAVASVLAAVAGHPAAAVTAGVAFLLLVVCVLLYLRISAPINRRLTAAS